MAHSITHQVEYKVTSDSIIATTVSTGGKMYTFDGYNLNSGIIKNYNVYIGTNVTEETGDSNTIVLIKDQDDKVVESTVTLNDSVEVIEK